MKFAGKWKAVLLGLILPAVILLVWYLVTKFNDVPRGILPSPAAVWKAFASMAKSGQIFKDLSVSLSRVAQGFLVSAVLGVFLGALMGMSLPAKAVLNPTLTALRQIPMIAWIPLVILWCGIGELSKVVLIVIAAFFPVMLNTMAGIANVPKELREVARLHRLSPVQIFCKVSLPSALPQILSGLRIAMGISWMALIAAELIAGTSGIGYRMTNARTLMRADILVACMIVVGVVGILLDQLLLLLFRIAAPWRKGESQ